MVELTKIEKLSESDLILYNEFVKESVEGTIFHTSWWRSLVDGFWGKNFTTDFYGVFENDKLVAAIPISHKSVLRFKIVYNSKLTPYSGPVFLCKSGMKPVSQASWRKSVNRDFAKILKAYNVCLYYPFNPHHIDLQPFIWEDFAVDVAYTYVLDLNNFTEVQQNMDKKRRNEIKGGLKAGYSVRKGQIGDFMFLYQMSMKRQNHSSLPPELWSSIFKKCKESNCCEVFTAYDNDNPLASLFLIWDNKRSYYLGGGIGDNPQYAMSLLIWEAIQFTKNDLKLNEFDFEGSSVETIESFFRSFGGNLRPVYRIFRRTLPREAILTLHQASLLMGR